MKRVPLAVCHWLFLGGLLAGTCLRAQDVTVTPVQWSDLRDPPNELPAIQKGGAFDFPAELRDTSDIGYVLLEATMDPRGRVLFWEEHTTLSKYAPELKQGQQRLTFSPAKRGNKGVNSLVTMAILFNPASAGLDQSDASPRLLEAAVVSVPKPKDAKPDVAIPDRVVFVELAVDEKGSVTGIKDVPTVMVENVRVALKNWRFAPARRGGQPIAASIRVPLVVVTDGGLVVKGKQVTPKPTDRVEPIYPRAMRTSGMRGEVLVEFRVDVEGRVKNPFVVRSLNPAFDDPAIEAVRRWRFEPGRVGDIPVITRMQVPIVFTLTGTVDGGNDGMLTTKKADMSKLPEGFRYDTPPRMVGSVRPVFPYALIQGGKEGRAIVRFLIDERGQVIQAVATEATTPEFGQALVTAVEQFAYEPAMKGGKPNKALMGFSQEFTLVEDQQLVSSEDLALLRREQKRPETILGPGELDRKLAPLSQRPPRFPLSLVDKANQGEAVIEFIVDDEGRARLPRVVSASEEAFGYAAVQGVAAWRFEAPTRGGRPAFVRVKVPIRFKFTESPAPSDTKK